MEKIPDFIDGFAQYHNFKTCFNKLATSPSLSPNTGQEMACDHPERWTNFVFPNWQFRRGSCLYYSTVLQNRTQKLNILNIELVWPLGSYTTRNSVTFYTFMMKSMSMIDGRFSDRVLFQMYTLLFIPSHGDFESEEE